MRPAEATDGGSGAGKPARADCPGAEPAAQQDRMAACNEQAVKQQFKGYERKQYISECLWAKI